MTGAAKTPEDYQIEDFVTDESFINYFFGLNTEDMTWWTKWLVAHPGNAALAEQAKDMLRSLSLTLPEAEFGAELSRMRKAIHDDAPLSPKRRPALFGRWHRGNEAAVRENGNGSNGQSTSRDRRKSKRAFATTLIILLLLAGAPFLWTRFDGGPGRLIQKKNESGKPVVFTLSDGTVVTLAPLGFLRYPANFVTKERKVILEGEAQFQVSRNEAHPFIVVEGDIVATVLGTVFHVKEQTADSAILVELISGKLKVETIARAGLSSQSILLAPDERVVYNRKLQLLVKEKWQSQHDPIHANHHLVFRKNNFEEIALQVKAAFGVTILNRSSKKNWRFTGDFVNTGAAEIVENICLVEGLHSETSGDTIIIKE